MSYPKTICVIPARIGSKRLTRKNLREVGGQTLLAHSIKRALEADLFDAVYVATESKEIAKEAKKNGAEVPILAPKEMCEDLSPSWEPCLHLADYLNQKENKEYDSILCLQPSSVLRSSGDIVEGMKVFLEENRDYLVSITPIDPHFFHWAMHEKGGSWEMYFGDKYMIDRQLLPPVFRPNGAIKVANLESLRKEKNFFGRNLGVIMMPEERSVHVVSETDLKIAELLMPDGLKN